MGKKRKIILIIIACLAVICGIIKYQHDNIVDADEETKAVSAVKDTTSSEQKLDEIKEAAQEKKDIQNQQKINKIEDYNKEQNRLALENKIKDYLGNKINNIGLSYYDINSGRTIVINGDKTFTAGSTLKVQMNMVLYDLVQSGQVSIDENLKYTDDCYEEGTGILQGQDKSKPLPLKMLSEYSITHSDNIATNMIIDRIGYGALKDYIDKKLGHATDHSGNYTTANDETTLLKLLYNNPDNNPYYPQIIDYMKRTDFHDRIDLYIPHDIAAHKIGDYGNYVNDVGIIYTKDPYILAIYTNEVPNASEVIAHISKLIYDYQNTLS